MINVCSVIEINDVCVDQITELANSLDMDYTLIKLRSNMSDLALCWGGGGGVN